MIKLFGTSVPVNDQAKALAFYTDVLGFQLKVDVPAGEYRWLTVVSPAAPDGVELLLEPAAFEPTKVYQAALVEAGIPWTQFLVDDLAAEYARLQELGVAFPQPPMEAGPVKIAILDDTCGNLIQLVEMVSA